MLALRADRLQASLAVLAEHGAAESNGGGKRRGTRKAAWALSPPAVTTGRIVTV